MSRKKKKANEEEDPIFEGIPEDSLVF